MFRHRLSKIGKATLFAACMLLAGGSFVSCDDDYFYPHEEPDWLGASIYDFLKTGGSSGHTYANFIELIDSLGEKETLAHTGSKTLFVADDAAFEKFYANNPWGVKSVSEMSKAQMKILFRSSMIDNAMLLDMLSSTGPNEADEGTCLRRLTASAVIDSIPLVKGEDMPVYNKFWDALRGKARTESLRIVKDGSAPMMVHILPEYLKNNTIRPSDINFLLKNSGKDYKDGEVLIFGNKVVDSDVPTDGFSDDTMTITCKNGYIYRLDSVLLPPSNMAEELRLKSKDEDLRVFSHLLDRFCIPVYDAALTAQVGVSETDSIFRLRYFVKDAADGITGYAPLEALGANPMDDERLIFDPGNNQIANSQGKERDMAVMFVPRDAYLYEYFVKGSGKFLLEQFASDVEVKPGESDSYASLIQALDSVPEKNIAPFLNNLMKPSFASSVPSKFNKVTDDANDEMGITETDVDKCLFANNGIIYIMNKVFGPAAYEAVSAPAIVFDNMRVMDRVNTLLKYNYYLLAMKAEYSYIIPDDAAFIQYDPVTKAVNSKKAYAYAYHFNDKRKGSNKDELWADKYEYDKDTYVILDTLTAEEVYHVDPDPKNNAFRSNFQAQLTDIMEYLIIVHDGRGDGIVAERYDDGTVITNPRKYYQTKGYGTVKVDTSDPQNIKFYGGEQLELDTEIAVANIFKQKNGFSFNTVPSGEARPGVLLSSVPTPPTKSVYTNMRALANEESDPFYEFARLCEPDGDAISKRLETIFKGAPVTKIKTDSTKLYSIFFSSADGKMVSLVPFFNTYHYTVYVPTNEAVKKELKKGLCDWDEISEIAADSVKRKKAAAHLRVLNNFLRYHFQDNSIYVDNVPFSIAKPEGGYDTEASFATSVMDPKTGRFYETTVKSDDANTTLLVTDQMDRTVRVIATPGEENKTWNIMTRDIEYNAKVPTKIATSSFAVMHSVDSVLLTEILFGYDGRYRRYTNDGELVDTMTVSGSAGFAELKDGSKPYLVANFGNVTMKDKDGKDKRIRLAYLMKPLAEGDEGYNAKHTREEYVLDAEGKKMLVDNEGMLVYSTKEKVKNEDGNTVNVTVYKYVVDDDNNMLQVANNGDVIKRIPCGDVSGEASN